MKLRSSFFVFMLIFSLALTSCSNSEPMISTVNSIVVFDYADYESLPDVRLSLSCETISDFHRVSVIKAKHVDSSLEWICNNPKKYLENKKNWVSYTNFRNTDDKEIPAGNYIFYCMTTDSKETEYYFTVEYPEALLTSHANDYVENTDVTLQVKYVLYDEYDNVIYYGEKKKKWTDLNSAKKDYPQTSYARICYTTAANKFVILMPVENFIEKLEEN